MTLHVNDNGTVKQATRINVNDNSTVRTVNQGWVNDNGTVKQFFNNDVISISDLLVDDSVFNPADASATYRLTNGGDVQAVNSLGTTDQGDWITPKINMANYEVRATLNSGSLSSGTTGSWLALSSTQVWTATKTVVGDNTAVLTIEIRRASDGAVMDTATITLDANVDT